MGEGDNAVPSLLCPLCELALLLSFASGALVAACAGAAACVAKASGALAPAAVGAALPVLTAFRAGVAPGDAFAVEVFSGVAAAAGAIARRSNSVQRVLSGVITKCACGQMARTCGDSGRDRSTGGRTLR